MNMIEAKVSGKRLNEIHKELWRYVQVANDNGLLNGFGGFISVRFAPEQVLITPPDIHPELLSPQDIWRYDIKGRRQNPTGHAQDHPEIAFVLNTMKARQDVLAIGHFHPLYASVFSKKSRTIPFALENAESILREILWVKCKVCPHRFEGLCQCIEGQRKSYTGVNHLLIENDGIVTMGKDLKEVCNLANLMEENAKAAYQMSTPAE